MNWSVADADPYNVLNEVLWKDAKGVGSKMPEPRANTIGDPGERHTPEHAGSDD